MEVDFTSSVTVLNSCCWWLRCQCSSCTGSKENRYGRLYADLIRSQNGSHWDIVSMRFARLDPDAVAEGTAPSLDEDSYRDIYFTSNDGPGTKTKIVQLEHMRTSPLNNLDLSRSSQMVAGVPRRRNLNSLTDDVVAAMQGHSVTDEQTGDVAPTLAKCPHVPLRSEKR